MCQVSLKLESKGENNFFLLTMTLTKHDVCSQCRHSPSVLLEQCGHLFLMYVPNSCFRYFSVMSREISNCNMKVLGQRNWNSMTVLAYMTHDFSIEWMDFDQTCTIGEVMALKTDQQPGKQLFLHCIVVGAKSYIFSWELGGKYQMKSYHRCVQCFLFRIIDSGMISQFRSYT